MSTRPPRNFFVESFSRDVGMLSRVADSLYWMGRYLERAEHTARLVNVELQLWLDQSPEMGAGRWRFLLEALNAPSAEGPVRPDETRQHPGLQPRKHFLNRLLHLHCSRKSPPRPRTVQHAHVGAAQPTLSRCHGDRPEEEWFLKSHDFFSLITEGAYLFHGITDATMSHGEGWQYIQLGRYVERADTLTTLLETHFRRMTTDFERPSKAPNISNGSACCAIVSPSKLIARSTPPKFVPCASPNS